VHIVVSQTMIYGYIYCYMWLMSLLVLLEMMHQYFTIKKGWIGI